MCILTLNTTSSVTEENRLIESGPGQGFTLFSLKTVSAIVIFSYPLRLTDVLTSGVHMMVYNFKIFILVTL